MPEPVDADAAVATLRRHWPTLPPVVAPVGSGHINDTYSVGQVGEPDAAGGRWVLQRLNRFVFRCPQAIMRNLAKAVAHDPTGLLVAPLPTAAGEPFAIDAAGDLWRLFPHVPGRCFQQLPPALAAAAGRAFGSFLAAFRDFDGALEPAVDGFHDLDRYLAALDDARVTPDAAAARREVQALRGGFPPSAVRQVIHGDCKVNNLLFHPDEDAVVAIIDLDTLMVGDPAWDFGDLARSAFIGAEEAAGPAALSESVFDSLCRGFAAAFPQVDDPVRYATAPAHMSFMLAVRFLTDHLAGDRYFKVARRGDNLERALAQLDLARRCRDAAPAFERALEGALGRVGGPPVASWRPLRGRMAPP